MAQPTTQLNATEQDTLVKQIGLALLRAAPRDWRRVTAEYRAVGRYHEMSGEIITEDGTSQEWVATHDIATLFGRLRAGMYRDGRGTWFNAKYQLDHPSSYNLEYNRDEPQWNLAPPPMAYSDELRMFPRSEDNVPEWVIRRMSGLAPEQPGPRFRIARIFDTVGPAGRPVINRPDLEIEEQDRLLDYLDSAPLVVSDRGYDVDRLAQTPEATVPVAFHSDGLWIWPAAVNFYLRQYGVSPELDLIEHVRAVGFDQPEVDEQTLSAAATYLQPPRPPGPPQVAPPPQSSAPPPPPAPAVAQSTVSPAAGSLAVGSPAVGSPAGAVPSDQQVSPEVEANATPVVPIATPPVSVPLASGEHAFTAPEARGGPEQTAPPFEEDFERTQFHSPMDFDETYDDHYEEPEQQFTEPEPAHDENQDVEREAFEPVAQHGLSVTNPADVFRPAEAATNPADVFRPTEAASNPADVFRPAEAPSNPADAFRPAEAATNGVEQATTFSPAPEFDPGPPTMLTSPIAPLAAPAAPHVDPSANPVERDEPAHAQHAEQPSATPAAIPDEPALQDLQTKLDELDIPENTYRIGEPAERGWSVEQVESGWRVGWYDGELTNPAMFGDAEDASAFMLGKLLLAPEGHRSPAEPEPEPESAPGPEPVEEANQPSVFAALSPDVATGQPLGQDQADPHTHGELENAELDDTATIGHSSAAPPLAAPRRESPPPTPTVAVPLPPQPVLAPPAPASAASVPPVQPREEPVRAAAQPEQRPPAGGQQQWPIYPMAGEPPLTLFRGKELRELPAGSELDRFGGPNGNLTYAAGTPFEERSLVPEWVNRPYHVYRVQRPLEALAGVAIPWFNQPGGGAAYLLPAAIDVLVSEGDLLELDPGEPPVD